MNIIESASNASVREVLKCSRNMTNPHCDNENAARMVCKGVTVGHVVATKIVHS